MKRTVVRVVVSGLVLALVGAGTRVPFRTDGEEARLRLSWRVRGIRIEDCRRLSAEELERLPVHMRREEVCEGRIAPYRLRVSVDGIEVENARVVPSGAREDRPLYVFREYPLTPGTREVEVSFALDATAAADSAAGALTWRGAVNAAAGDVLLITHDAVSDALVLRTPTAR